MGEMTFSPGFWALAALALGAATAYGLYFLQRPPSWPRALVKTLFMGAGAAALVTAQAPTTLVFAVIASAAGDFFLAFDRKWLLPFGIVAFLLAQAAYFLIFSFFWFEGPDGSPLEPRYAAMALIGATTVIFLAWMASKLKWMALAVVPYAAAITAMAAMAMWVPWTGWPAMLGAVSFVVSDFVLATELFRLAPDAPARRVTAPLVWWTYVAAQALIVWGVLRLAEAN